MFSYPHAFQACGGALEKMAAHPIHCLLGWISSKDGGLKVDLTAFPTSKDFLKSVRVATLAQILYIFAAAGMILHVVLDITCIL